MENIKFDDLDEKDDDFDIEEKLKNFENSDSNSNKNDNLNIISEIDFKIKLENIQNLQQLIGIQHLNSQQRVL